MQKTDMEGCVSVSALDTNAADLTVVDVYDIAAIVGQEFERIIDQFGCESLLRLMPKVVRILEVLEVLVGRSTAVNPETEALRRELDRLRQERNDRQEKEKQHQKELESVEDEWRGEAQDLLLQITQLQGENKRLLINLSLKNSPITTEELQQHEGMSEKEQQMMNKLKDMVDKQRDEIRAKDHELTRRNEDIEALQMQQHRLMKINQDLRHRTGVVESRGKALIQQKAELEAAAQARHQELGALRLEAARLREERLEWELQREVVEKVEPVPTKAKMSPPTSAQRTSLGAETADSIKQNSVWVECGGDPGFLADCFESREGPSLLPSSAKKNGEDEDEDVGATALLLEELYEGGPEEVTDSLEKESEKPRFTLEELRDVLQERNELKSEVFMLQEELAYYKSEELEDEGSLVPLIPSPPLYPAPVDQPDSGIKRLIFTAIMPMVAAGLIGDDPTLMPIRRLISFV